MRMSCRAAGLGRGLMWILAALLLPGAAGARDLFVGRISIAGNQFGGSTSKLREVPELFDNASLGALDPTYDPNDPVSAGVDLRGLPTLIGFDLNSTELFFQIPAIGLDVRFDAGDRNASQEQFEEWLAGNFSSLLADDALVTSVLQALVEYSPVDPVAGNPNSLQSRMFAADYQMGTSGPLIGSGGGGEDVRNLFSLRPAAGLYKGGPFDVTALDLPFNYAVNWEYLSLIVDVPLTATVTEGAWGGMGSLGLGLQVRPFGWWALTPAARIGGVGSIDVGGLAVMYSGTLTSQLRIPLGPIALGIGNMGGAAKTVDGIEIGGYGLAYELLNWVTRNGGYLEGTFGPRILGGALGWRVFGSDVRFFGDELFLDSYAEAGVSLASARQMGEGRYDFLDVTFAYLWGDGYKGGSLRFGVRF